MLEDKSYCSRNNTPVVCLSEILKVTLCMKTHFRVILPLLTRLSDYCRRFNLTKSVSMDDLRLCHLSFWPWKCSRSEHRVSFARARLSICKNRTVVPIQELWNDWSDNLVENFRLTILIQYHIKSCFQVMVQVWLHRDMLFECLYDVFMAKFDFRMQRAHTHRYLQSLVQGLANLLVW